ncbi:unnamed protein product [Thlaspi arvense]|uniref:Uncharacterized protein n=1 Tax=Thlaspi arvense TaxID=13288 RepID=A0AAU9SKX5_THLAR|nr:unnamed protein product [Thlaspi arvense]
MRTKTKRNTNGQLFDEAMVMNNYTTKNPNPFGREYMVEKFNSAFNMNITYVGPEISMIYASDAWWKEHELLRMQNNKGFQPTTPRFLGCDGAILTHSAGQRRRELINEREDSLYGSDTDSGRFGGTSRPSTGGDRRRQSFETTIQDTIAGCTEFQRQSLQQLCLGAFDQNDYDE